MRAQRSTCEALSRRSERGASDFRAVGLKAPTGVTYRASRMATSERFVCLLAKVVPHNVALHRLVRFSSTVFTVPLSSAGMCRGPSFLSS